MSLSVTVFTKAILYGIAIGIALYGIARIAILYGVIFIF